MTIEEHIDLQALNTFGLHVRAKYYTEIHEVDELYDLTRQLEFQTQRRLILGGGSNMLLMNDYAGLVIRNCLLGTEVIDEDDDHIWLNVQAGENWHNLVTYCVDQGWGGLENLALIPGCVGAAPIQNIGAYGVEFKDVFVSLEAFHWDDRSIHVYYTKDCAFGYRDSVFKRKLKNKVMILSVTIKLSKTPEVNTAYGAIQKVLDEKSITRPKIMDVYEAVIQVRQSKLPDPEEIGNAGSFFKNPELPKAEAERILKDYPDAPHYVINDETTKIPAGWMIDQCGLKGYRNGDAGVHTEQALVIVNHGNAKGDELVGVARMVQKTVKETFGVTLQPEVNIID